MLAICAALWWELGPVLDAVGKVRRVPHDGPRIWKPVDERIPVLLFRTGVGPERAAASTRSILRTHPIDSILNTGSAGALVPNLLPGALVIPSACYAEGEAHEADAALTARLRRAAQSARMTFDHGPTLTSPAALVTTDQKRAAHQRWEATAVEMEGTAVARLAREHGVRFAAARSVLDPLHLDLPFLEKTARTRGLIDRLKLSCETLGHPGQFPSLLEVTVAARAVRASLRLFFAALLRLPGSIEEEFEKGR
jgi:nucleoside phosphorylase